MDYILTTRALSKHYSHFKALNGLSMHVPKGSIYGFVGKNGAGKTTLIRLICGLQNPTSGDYSLYNISNGSSAILNARRRIGAVVETPSIYLNMTAEENLKQQYQILGLPSFDGIPDLLKLVGLENTGKKKAKNFSLGMRQRLGIAVALAGDPDFLVLDEPANGNYILGFLLKKGRLLFYTTNSRLLFAIRLCRINAPISYTDRIQHTFLCLLRRCLVNSVSKHRHFHPVI